MKTKCLQLSVDAARWPDDMLQHLIYADGEELKPADARAELIAMKTRGMQVVPCGTHRCEADGTCTGESL